jgi:hypothetical protein
MSSGSPLLRAFCHSRLDNRPVRQQNDKEHSLDRSLNRFRETEKPIRNWACTEFLALQHPGLHLVESRHPVGRNFCRLLFQRENDQDRFHNPTGIPKRADIGSPGREIYWNYTHHKHWILYVL